MSNDFQDERSVSFLYLGVSERKEKLLLFGKFTTNEINGYKKFFENVYIFETFSSFNNYGAFSIDSGEIKQSVFQYAIFKGNFDEIRKNINFIDTLRSNNPDIVLIFLIKKFIGLRNFVELNKLIKNNFLSKFLFLPQIESFKLVLDCNNVNGCVHSLKLYNPVTSFQIFRNFVILFFIRTKLINLIPIGDVLLISETGIKRNYFINFLKRNEKKNIDSFGLHNASAGIGTKAILAPINNEEGILGFLKVSNEPIRKEFIINEFKNLKNLNQMTFSTAEVPSVKYFIENEEFTAIFFENKNYNLKPSGFILSENHLIFLAELFHNTKKKGDLSFWNRIIEKINILSDKNTEIKKMIIKGVRQLKKQFGNNFSISLAHKDFVSWNIKINNENKIYVYDWEWAGYTLPFYDIFHFIIHGNLNIKKQNLENSIKALLLSEKYTRIFYKISSQTGQNMSNIRFFLLYYLIDRILLEYKLGTQNFILYKKTLSNLLKSSNYAL